MKENKKEDAVKKIVVEIKNTDKEKQNFILGYLEALKDLNALTPTQPKDMKVGG